MGTWGTGPFANDDASDWVYDLEGADDLALVRDALEEADEVRGYLDAAEGARALAAAEVIAAAGGNRADELPEEIESWLDTVRPQPTAADLELARRAIARVLGERSELAELWTASADAQLWKAGIASLQKRLS